MVNKLTDKERGKRKLEKEKLAEFKRSKNPVTCSCDCFISRGEDLRESMKNMYNHIKEKHSSIKTKEKE